MQLACARLRRRCLHETAGHVIAWNFIPSCCCTHRAYIRGNACATAQTCWDRAGRWPRSLPCGHSVLDVDDGSSNSMLACEGKTKAVSLPRLLQVPCMHAGVACMIRGSTCTTAGPEGDSENAASSRSFLISSSIEQLPATSGLQSLSRGTCRCKPDLFERDIAALRGVQPWSLQPTGTLATSHGSPDPVDAGQQQHLCPGKEAGHHHVTTDRP